MNSIAVRTLSLFAASALLLAAAQNPSPQNPSPQLQQKKKTTGFVLEAGEHELGNIIDKAAKFLGRNLLYTPQELTIANAGPITLQKRLVLDARGCEEVVSQLAYSRGIVMTPVDANRGVWEFVATQGRRRGLIQQRTLSLTTEEVLRRPQLCVRTTTTLQLQHVSANFVHNLRAQFSQNNTMPPYLTMLGQRGVVISGFMQDVATMVKAIRESDRKDNITAPNNWHTWRQRLPAVEKQLPSIKSRLSAIENALSRQLRKK